MPGRRPHRKDTRMDAVIDLTRALAWPVALVLITLILTAAYRATR